MLTTLLIVAALAILLLGMMGGVGIFIVTVLGFAVWLAAPLAVTLVFGLFSLAMLPVLKALAPDIWEIIARPELEQRRRRQFFKSLDRANARAGNRPRVDHGDRRDKGQALGARVGSHSGPQVRTLEHRAKLDPPTKPEDREPHD